jgi:quinol monooxygenase YgiN
MDDRTVHWIARFAVHAGRSDEFRRLAEQVVALVGDSEPGQLRYRWHLSPDGRTCWVDAWYADADAALAHLGGRAVAELLPSLLEVSDLAGVTVLGEVTDPALGDALAGLGAEVWPQVAGFTREPLTSSG